MTDPVDISQIDAAVRDADLNDDGFINASEYNRLLRHRDIASRMVADAIQERLDEDGNNQDYDFNGIGMPIDYVYAIVEDAYNHSHFPRPQVPDVRGGHHHDRVPPRGSHGH